MGLGFAAGAVCAVAAIGILVLRAYNEWQKDYA